MTNLWRNEARPRSEAFECSQQERVKKEGSATEITLFAYEGIHFP